MFVGGTPFKQVMGLRISRLPVGMGGTDIAALTASAGTWNRMKVLGRLLAKATC